MSHAIELARRGPAGDVNPQVGCVLLDPEGHTVAEGWHCGVGSEHAETAALAALPPEWRDRSNELTAVVTLEPCNHTGHTGPCAVALRDFGIGAVAFAQSDPTAAAGGAETLRKAGVEVLGGVLADEAAELLAPWLERTNAHSHAGAPPANRPQVTVKWAQTLDGRAAAADGTSQWITGPDARADVHRWRAEADAILVGTGTLLADDPALTARSEDGGLLVPAAEQPVPVVLGRRAIPHNARVLRHPALSAHGLTTPIQLTGEDLEADLAALAAQGIERLFVEGGPTVASALIAQGLVDEVLVYVAPALLGGPGLALGDIGAGSMEQIRRLDVIATERLGHDLLIRAAIVHTEPA